MLQRRLLLGLVALALALPIWAAPAQLIIVEAVPNSQTGLLTIIGVNLGGSSAVVTLGGQTLTLQAGASETQLLANLPALSAGTYLLAVARGNATVEQDTFSVTIGAAGGGGGGEIESIVATDGLTGGGSSGEVAIGVDTGFFNHRYARLAEENTFVETQTLHDRLYINQTGDPGITLEVHDHDAGQRIVEINGHSTEGCTQGLQAQMQSACTTAVAGLAQNPDGGIGGGFETRGFNGIGLQAYHNHPTGNGMALFARTHSPDAVVAELASDGGGVIINGVNASVLVFQVLGDGTVNATDFVEWSSRRFKTNVTPIENALAAIEGLRPVSFDWKATGERDLGLIAEEVAEVVPDAVTFDEQGAKGLDYSSLTALLIEAVKEQQQAIKAQQRQIQELQHRLETLD